MSSLPLHKADIHAVNSALPTPLYHQIYLILHDKIIDGVYPHGGVLPGETELMEMFGVSRITAKRALNELAAEGFVTRERGRGTTVIFKPSETVIRARVDGFLEHLVIMGRKTTVKVLDFGYAGATDDVSRALQIPMGSAVQRSVRVRSLDGKPFSYLVAYVPEEIGRTWTREELAKHSMLSLIERCKIKFGEAEQSIGAALADTHAGPALDAKVGSALMRISRVVCDHSGKPVEYLIALYRPDRYQYRMRLERSVGKDGESWVPSA